MCTFITATINEGADLKALEPVFLKWTCGFGVVREAGIADLLPPGRIYLGHQGHCDCGTEIGRGPTSYRAHITDHDLKKLQKRGWGDAKIRRWQLEKLQAQEKQHKTRPRPDVDDWLELIREVLATPTVTVFGLMHHFTGAGAYQDRFELTILPQKSIDDAEPSDLYELRSDRLQEFVW